MKHTPLTWLSLRWPREVTEAQVLSAWRRLPTLAGWPLIVEAIGHDGLVRHRMAVPVSRERTITRQLRAELPGLGIEADSSAPIKQFQMAGEVRLTSRRRSVATTDLAGASRAILTALAQAGQGELLLLQWVLGHPLHPQATPSSSTTLSRESWVEQAVDAVLLTKRPADSEPRKALAAKQAEPGWRTVGRLAARAATEARQELLLRQLAGAVRTLETPGLRVIVRRRKPQAAQHATIPYLWPLRLNSNELAALAGWPVGETSELPVDALTSRPMPAARAIARSGRVVAEATYPGAVRPLALSSSDSTRHLYVLGPTGTGKSTLLLNIISQDLQAGHGVIVIEPKDLINDVLARIPTRRINDVVLVDALDRTRPIGLNPLAPMGRSPELVADQLLGTFHDLYPDNFGIHTQDILGATLMTVAQLPDMTLAAVPVLLTNPDFRRRVLSRINDPGGLDQFWSDYETWTDSQRTTAIAPVLNKLRIILLRPALRAILGQARPRFDVRQVFTERKVLLVNLGGQLGPEAGALLGSLVIGQVWQAAQGRAAVAPERRRPVFLYVDEAQKYLHLPVDLADALAQARGLSLSLTLANQHLAQLPPDVRAAVLANAQSKVSFRLAPDDARVMAAGSRLAPEDFSGLGAYECYMQLVADQAVQPWASGRSLPPPEVISDPAVVRAASRANYGQDRREVDEALEKLFGSGRHDGDTVDDLKPRRRGGRP